MNYLIWLIWFCLIVGVAYIAYGFCRDMRGAWREEFPKLNRRRHTVQIGFKACKPQEDTQ